MVFKVGSVVEASRALGLLPCRLVRFGIGGGLWSHDPPRLALACPGCSLDRSEQGLEAFSCDVPAAGDV